MSAHIVIISQADCYLFSDRTGIIDFKLGWFACNGQCHHVSTRFCVFMFRVLNQRLVSVSKIP